MIPGAKERLLSYEDAVKLVLENVKALATLSVKLDESLYYTLAEDVRAPNLVPSFDSSAVDGYAVLLADVAKASAEAPARLKVAGEMPAGAGKIPKLKPGETIKVFTGARIPKNTEAVIMREYVKEDAGYALISVSTGRNENIRFAGEEFRKGSVVFSSGTLITPAVVGMLASLGLTTAKVFGKPKVALMTTGNEVVPPEVKPKAGQIRNSNLVMLSSALMSLGIEPILTLHSGDEETVLSKNLERALKVSDLLLAVGGVSVGDYDFVKSALIKLGVKEVFWRVAIKPGKPVFFGKKGEKLVFGLPGNSVSAMVCFVLFVLPALKKMMGRKDCQSLVLTAHLAKAVEKKRGRAEFLRGNFRHAPDGKLIVAPLKAQGSHMLGGLASANCLIFLPEDCEALPAKSQVKIIPLNWSVFL